MTKRYQTESVPTNTLKVGDTILVSGGLFRVIRVKDSVSHDASGPGGVCRVNHCEFLGNAWDDQECQIPASWRDGRPADFGRPEYDNFWNEQGNGLARTARVIGVDHCG